MTGFAALLLDTKDFWLPVVSGALKQAAVSPSGLRLLDQIKAQFNLEDPAAVLAFHEAFTAGVESYSNARGHLKAAEGVAEVLSHVAKEPTALLDRSAILQQIFRSSPDEEQIVDVVKRYAWAYQGLKLSQEDVSCELSILITDHLRHAFMTHRYYANQVGFVVLAELLREVVQILKSAPPGGLSPEAAVKRGSLPPPVSKEIFGREPDLVELRQLLFHQQPNKPPKPNIVVLYGNRGIGKGVMLRLIAHDQQTSDHFSDGALYTSLGPKPNLEEIRRGWLETLGVSAGSRADSISILANELRRQRRLLIIDDVWEQAHLEQLLVGGVGCMTVFATRDPRIAGKYQRRYKLHPLSETASLAVLQSAAPDVIKQFPSQCLALARKLHGSPLLLNIAGDLLRQVDTESEITDLVKELRAGQRAQNAGWSAGPGFGEADLPADMLSDKSVSVRTYGKLLERSLASLDEQTRKCFLRLCVLPPAPASFTKVVASAVCSSNDPGGLNSSLDLLVSRGLVDQDLAKNYQVHPVTAAICAAKLPLEARRSVHQKAAKYYADLPATAPNVYQAAYHAAELADWRQVAELLTRSGVVETLTNQGYAEAAKDLYLHCIDQYLPLALRISCYLSLGFIANRLRDMPAASAYYEQALNLLAGCDQETQRSLRVHLIFTHQGLGEVAEARDDPEKAIYHFTQALEIAAGADPSVSASLLVSLGDQYAKLKTDESAQRATEYLDKAVGLSRNDPAIVARANIVLGNLMMDQDRFVEAGSHFETAAAAAEGRDLFWQLQASIHLIECNYELANAGRDQGSPLSIGEKYEKAIAAGQQAVALSNRCGTIIDRVRALNSYGYLLYAIQDDPQSDYYVLAEHYLLEARETCLMAMNSAIYPGFATEAGLEYAENVYGSICDLYHDQPEKARLYRRPAPQRRTSGR